MREMLLDGANLEITVVHNGTTQRLEKGRWTVEMIGNHVVASTTLGAGKPHIIIFPQDATVSISGETSADRA